MRCKHSYDKEGQCVLCDYVKHKHTYDVFGRCTWCHHQKKQREVGALSYYETLAEKQRKLGRRNARFSLWVTPEEETIIKANYGVDAMRGTGDMVYIQRWVTQEHANIFKLLMGDPQ